VSVLQDKLLAPLRGIDDPRTSKRVDFVGGICGPDGRVKRVNTDGSVAVSMCPVTLAQLMDIADAGQIMPPKKHLVRTQTTFRTLCAYALGRLDALFIFLVDAVSEEQKAMTGRAELAYLSNPYRKLLEHIMQYYTILTALAGTMLVCLGCLP